MTARSLLRIADYGGPRCCKRDCYLAILVLFWSCPDVTADRLLLNGLWTAWMVVGTLLEEADLVAEFGDAYRSYRRAVPMLIPTTKRSAGQLGEPTHRRSSSGTG